MRRPGRPSPLVLFPLAALLGAASLGALGCERRIEEPIALSPSEHARGGPRAQAPKPERCIRRSPPQPKRSTPKGPDPKCPKDDQANPKALRLAKVTFPEAKALTVTVEVAETDRDRQRGLMFRTKMADDHGMIFNFAEKDNHTFWMHNTCIPLDMLYIDDDGMIVGIEENTPTMSDDTFEVGCDSKYVLEVNAGWTRAHGVFAGQKATLEGI